MKFSNPAVGLLLAVPSNIILILYENKTSYFDLSQTGLPKLKLHRPCSKFYFLQWYRICHKMNTCQIRSRGSCSLVFMKLMHKATIVLKTADLCSLSLPLLSYDDDFFFFNGKNEHSLFINADCFVQLDERKKKSVIIFITEKVLDIFKTYHYQSADRCPMLIWIPAWMVTDNHKVWQNQKHQFLTHSRTNIRNWFFFQYQNDELIKKVKKTSKFCPQCTYFRLVCIHKLCANQHS